MTAASKGPLPIVVGVTGHRDIPDDAVERLEAAVASIFDRLESEHPHAPILVVSALADGADQLVARVAVRRGLALLAPLPMPREIYATAVTDRAQLDSLLAGADAFELPLADGVTPDALRSDERARARQYGVLAAFLARQCHGLIALWDGTGTENPLEGGTAQVVAFHRSGVPVPLMPPQYPPDPVDLGPTWHVVTPRAGKPMPPGAFEVREIQPVGHESDDAARRLHRGIRERIDTFNRDALAMPDSASPEHGLPPEAAAKLPAHALATARRQALVDAMAQRWQARAYRALGTLPWAAGAAVVLLQVYADWIDAIGFLTAYVIALGMAWSYFWWTVARTRTQDRYQDYRALAEGLRVELFRQATGAAGCAADHYLGRQRSELDWIRQALRAWALASPEARSAMLGREGPPDRARLELARDFWIDDQARYYERAARRDRARLRRWEIARTAGFALSVAAAIVASLAVQAAPAGSWLRHAFDGAASGGTASERWHAGLVTLIALPAVAAGLIEYFLGRRAFAEHARQYARMAGDLQLARQRLDALLASGQDAEARAHLLRLADLTLAEHGDWLLLHRERPIDVPQGG